MIPPPRPAPVAPPPPGWVYVLTCPDFPGCCKIGGTAWNAALRAVQLVEEYGTSNPFTVVDRIEVPNWSAVEQAAHRMLSDCRLPRSELFRCTPAKAGRVIRAAAAAYARPWALTVWLRRLVLPRPKRLSRGWRRSRRRGSADGLIVLAVLVAIAAPVVILKPDLPPWLPASVIRAAVLLERLR